MKIAVLNEVSSAERNTDILRAMDGLGHEIINAGMKKGDEKPELSYIHTGFMSAILLNTGCVDFVIGGCGTGQGFLNSVMQYPGVSCGLIKEPLDAWLFMQINGGNCISLTLNQGYGWAGDINLRFIFEKLFSVERGAGYPDHRREPQKQSRLLLEKINNVAHNSMQAIITKLPDEALLPLLGYPGFIDLVRDNGTRNKELLSILEDRKL